MTSTQYSTSAIGLMQFDLLGFATHADVEHLNADGESHGKVDVAFGDVLVESLRHKHTTNEQQKTERQHFDGRMSIHEVADFVHEHQHDDHRNDHGRNHHFDLR